jgi:hypothetical protein
MIEIGTKYVHYNDKYVIMHKPCKSQSHIQVSGSEYFAMIHIIDFLESSSIQINVA